MLISFLRSVIKACQSINLIGWVFCCNYTDGTKQLHRTDTVFIDTAIIEVGWQRLAKTSARTSRPITEQMTYKNGVEWLTLTLASRRKCWEYSVCMETLTIDMGIGENNKIVLLYMLQSVYSFN